SRCSRSSGWSFATSLDEPRRTRRLRAGRYAHPPVDLAKASVFLDFDGTVTTADTGVHLLERLATRDWRAVDDAYRSGTIGSREAIELQWAMLPPDEARLRAVAREVAVDPGLGPLVDALRAAGAELLVVSDG